MLPIVTNYFFLKITVIFRDLVDRESNVESKCNFSDRRGATQTEIKLAFAYRVTGSIDPRVKTPLRIPYWGKQGLKVW